MDSYQFTMLAGFLALIGTIIMLFLWNRAESRADNRHFQQENTAIRRELIDALKNIDTEMKDFHGRLCAIEERRK